MTSQEKEINQGRIGGSQEIGMPVLESMTVGGRSGYEESPKYRLVEDPYMELTQG